MVAVIAVDWQWTGSGLAVAPLTVMSTRTEPELSSEDSWWRCGRDWPTMQDQRDCRTERAELQNKITTTCDLNPLVLLCV